MNFIVMKTLAHVLTSMRKAKSFKVIDLALAAEIDPSLISRYENGSRLPSEKHINSLAANLSDHDGDLRKYWIAEKVSKLLQYEHDPSEVLKVAEQRIAFLNGQHAANKTMLDEPIRQLLTEIDELQQKWASHRPMNSTQMRKLSEYFRTQYTHESNQIEGNTLSLRETHLVINEGITISGKSLVEHLEAINHSEAVDFIIALVDNKEDLTKRTLLELHRLILKSIDNEYAGRYRDVPVRISGSQHIPPQPYLIEKMMEDYFLYYERNKHSLHPVILAAEMHERLVSIHPFIDGNGRTSRLVMNLILIKNGFTIASLKGDDVSRQLYYSALEDVQINNKPTPFYGLIIDRVRFSLTEHLSLV